LQIFSLSTIFNSWFSLSLITHSAILYANTLSMLTFIFGSISFYSRHNLSRSLYFHKFQVPDQFFWNLKINYAKYSFGIFISSCGVIFLFSSFSFSRISVIGTDFSTMLQAWSIFGVVNFTNELCLELLVHIHLYEDQDEIKIIHLSSSSYFHSLIISP